MKNNHYSPSSDKTEANTFKMDPFFELELVWHFTKRDLPTMVIPAILYTCTALKLAQIPLLQSIMTTLLVVLFLLAILLVFNISNQLCDIEEDRIDKPDRPLPSGMISLKGAQDRCFFCAFTGLTIALHIEAVPWTILFYAMAYMHNNLGGKRLWHLRTYLTATGILIPIIVGWKTTAPIPTPVLLMFLYIKVLWCIMGPIQDLRDLDGDSKSGRKSFPIVFGVGFTKLYAIFGGLGLNIMLHFVLSSFGKSGFLVVFCEAVLMFSLCALTVRIYTSQKVREYKQCFLWFMLYYDVLCLSGCLLLLS